MFRVLCCILLFSIISNFGHAQDLDSQILKALAFKDDGDTTKAVSIIKQARSSFDLYNKFLTYIYEIRWSGKNASRTIAEIKKNRIAEAVRTKFPRDTINGFFLSSLARNKSLSFKDHIGASRIHKDALSFYESIFGVKSRRIESKYLRQAIYAKNAEEFQFAIDNYMIVLGFSNEKMLIRDKYLANLYTNVGWCYLNTEQFEESIKYSEKASAIYKELGLNESYILSEYRIATIYQNSEQIGKAYATFDHVLQLTANYGKPRNLNIGWVNYYVANFSNKSGLYDKAFTSANDGLGNMESADKGSWLEFYLNYEAAFAKAQMNEFDQAIDYKKRCIELETKLREDICELRSAYLELSLFERRAGNIDGAVGVMNKVIELSLQCKVKGNALARIYQNLAVDYWNHNKDLPQAIRHWELARAQLDGTSSVDEQLKASIMLQLSRAYFQSDQIPKAREFAQKSRSSFKSLANYDSYHEANIEYIKSCYALEDPNASRDAVMAGLDVMKSKSASPFTLGLYSYFLGKYYLQSGELDKALEKLNGALRNLHGDYEADIYNMMADIYYEKKDSEKAIYYYDEFALRLQSLNRYGPNQQILVMMNKARLYENERVYDKASIEYEKTLAVMENEGIENENWLLGVLDGLSFCYKKLKQDQKLEVLEGKYAQQMSKLKN